MKAIVAILVVGVLVLGAYWFLNIETAQPVPSMPTEEEAFVPSQDDEICIQVITPARNPDTGEFREFPTPCDIPEGWQIVQPEGLDLQVI